MADEDRIEVPVVWVGADELPVLFVNQFIGQADKAEVFLTIGQMVPPAVIGTEAERREQLEHLQYAQIRPVARLAMTPAKLRDLLSILEVTLRNAEKQQEALGDPRHENRSDDD